MRKNESGRSMVEMLGVLAIIGVLSIGGIAGYTLSMNRFRANAIVDAANKYASLVFGSCQSQYAQGSDACTVPSFESLGLTAPDGVEITAPNAPAAGDTSVTVSVGGFPSEGVQDAYAAIVNETTADPRTHAFPQN